MKKKFEDDRQREVSLLVSKGQLVGESGTKRPTQFHFLYL